MNDRRYTVTLIATCLTILVATAMLARGGPIDPPAGPVAPTMKTLAEVEPRIPVGPDTTPGDSANIYVISQSGSYYLTGNIVGEAGKTGIRITGSHVVLDLNGAMLGGVPESREGIRISGNHVTVRNGSVVGWGRQGIRGFSELSQKAAIIEDVSVVDNHDDGIDIYEGGAVRRCNARGNGGHGIQVYSGCLIDSCIVRNNTADGINTNFACIVRNSTSMFNGGDGIRLGMSSQASECIAYDNNEHGIEALDDCNFTACNTDRNTLSGIYTGHRAIVRGCGATLNGTDGIRTGFAATVAACSGKDNGESGIWASFGSAVFVVAGRTNSEFGIYTNTGCSLSFAAASDNDNGMSASLAFGSMAWANSITGITIRGLAQCCSSKDQSSGTGFALSQYSRIHECSAAGNRFGFRSNTFDPVVFSSNSAFDTVMEPFDDTFPGQDVDDPVNATSWENFYSDD